MRIMLIWRVVYAGHAQRAEHTDECLSKGNRLGKSIRRLEQACS
jgi:hypothetical protein